MAIRLTSSEMSRTRIVKEIPTYLQVKFLQNLKLITILFFQILGMNMTQQELYVTRIVISKQRRSSTNLVIFYYRQWKCGVTGLNDQGSQLNDLNKLVKIWARCTNSDTDLCSRMSDEPRFQYQNLANMDDLLIADDSSSLVEDFVIIRQVHGSIQRSCLDQIITNGPSKMTWPEILGSLHCQVFQGIQGSRTTKKRIYKDFDQQKLRADTLKAKEAGAFQDIENMVKLDDDAIDLFTSVCNSILEEYSPIKIESISSLAIITPDCLASWSLQ